MPGFQGHNLFSHLFTYHLLRSTKGVESNEWQNFMFKFQPLIYYFEEMNFPKSLVLKQKIRFS